MSLPGYMHDLFISDWKKDLCQKGFSDAHLKKKKKHHKIIVFITEEQETASLFAGD